METPVKLLKSEKAWPPPVARKDMLLDFAILICARLSQRDCPVLYSRSSQESYCFLNVLLCGWLDDSNVIRCCKNSPSLLPLSFPLVRAGQKDLRLGREARSEKGIQIYCGGSEPGSES